MGRYFLVLAVLLLSGCLTPPGENEIQPGGTYDLVAYRKDGTPDTKGWIRFSVLDDGRIEGAWELAGIEGDGTLAGRREGDSISLDLHPGWADHNFRMTGTQRGAIMEGTWEFVGFAGPMRNGAFIATKK